MKLVHFFVGALSLAVGSAHAAGRSDLMDTMSDADRHLARQDVAGAQRELENLAVRLTAGASVAGREARVAVNGVLAALEQQSGGARAKLHDTMEALGPQEGASRGYSMGWRMGYADARAGVYTDHRPTSHSPDQDDFYKGYEEGWGAGSSASGY